MPKLKRVVRTALQEAVNASLLPKRGRYVMVFAQERTGSTLFMDLLNTHPRILADQHLFFTPFDFPDAWRDNRVLLSRKPVRAYKAKVTHRPQETSIDKLRRRIVDLSGDVSLVLLRRRNKLKQAFSAGVCDSTGVQQRLDGREMEERPAINVPKFLKTLNYYSVLTSLEDEALKDVEHLTVTYEDDLLDSSCHQETANRVFRYLGLNEHPVRTRISRTSSRPLSESISNYPDVVEAVRLSPYRDLLT